MADQFDPIALFQRSVAKWPAREALRIEGSVFSYAELDRWSDAVAFALIDAEAAHERVAFVANKRPASYANVLGILKAGCSYVPLHPDGPQARWQRMLSISGTRFVLGEGPVLSGLRHVEVPTGITKAFTSTAFNLGAEAYVLFTSGSTGGPKGVSVSRANVAAYLSHLLTEYDFNERDRFTQFFALTFDLSVHDLFVCWGAGGCLCVPPDESALRAAAFTRDERISVWFSVPSLPALMTRNAPLT